MWVHMVMETLSEGLKNNFVSSFYLPRQNLLNYYHISKKAQAKASQALDMILKGLKRNPRSIYRFSGSVDPQEDEKDDTRRDADVDNEGFDEPDQDEQIVNKLESEDEEEEQGFYEENSVANSGWPIDKGGNPSSVKGDHQIYQADRPDQPQLMYEDDSGISKPTRVGERSDIY